ncbi:MAG: FHA domain-containing protein [Candidatus Methylomirabilales bacterium]
MLSPIFPRTAALLEAKACPLARFDALFANITQGRRVGDGYFVQAHPDGSRLLFVVGGAPYGVGLLAGEVRRFLDIREFFTAYRSSPEAPLAFYAADKRLLLGLMVCFQHRPARLFPESALGDAVIKGLEEHGEDAILCLRSGDEWGITLCAKGRPVVNYFPPSGAHALQMGTTPSEQLLAYLATLSPGVELYADTRVRPATDVIALTPETRGRLSQIFLGPQAVEPEPILALEVEPAAPLPSVEAPPAPQPEPEAPPAPPVEPPVQDPPLPLLEAWSPGPSEPEPAAPPTLAPAPEPTPVRAAEPMPMPAAGAAPEPVRVPAPEPAAASAASSAAGAKAVAPEIQVFVGERQIGTFSLAGGEVTVGRTPGNTILIENPGVSRRHAVIRLEGGRAILEDLGSANGTFVNGQRISRHELAEGDEIAIVKHRLLFRLPRTGEPAAKAEPLLDGQKTMFIDSGTVAQAVAGRQPGRGETATPVLRPRLILPDRKLSLEDQREITLGSGPDCDVQLSGMFVARLHAKIVGQREGVFKLVHVAGLAGTRVNGEKISEHLLKHGDEIEIAKQKILFRLER